MKCGANTGNREPNRLALMEDGEVARRLALGLRERRGVKFTMREDHTDDEDEEGMEASEEEEEEEDEGADSESGDSGDDDYDYGDEEEVQRRSYRRLGQQRVKYAEADENSGEEDFEIEEERRRAERRKLAERPTALLDLEQEEEAMSIREVDRVLEHRIIGEDNGEEGNDFAGGSQAPDVDGEKEKGGELAEVPRRGSPEAGSTTLPTVENCEVLVKWKRYSHVHASWQPCFALKDIAGYKKVLNYLKNAQDRIMLLQQISPEEAEQLELEREMERDLLNQHTQAERIITERTVSDVDGQDTVQYLVKWRGLPYCEVTWETCGFLAAEKVSGAQEAIEQYAQREANLMQPLRSSSEVRRLFREKQIRPLTEQPSCLKNGQLRDYQLTALNFMTSAWHHKRNVILADEMGLGKTCQTISLISYLFLEHKLQGPYLVVVPLSVITNWLSEFEKWAPSINVVVYVGDGPSREVIRDFEWHSTGGRSRNQGIKFDVMLTTYDVMMRDSDAWGLNQMKWTHMMIDEAHRLKNVNARIYEVLNSLRTDCRLLISGTPLQNELKELWALLHFCEPQKFPDCDEFEELYSMGTDADQAQSGKRLQGLHKALKPYLLRRVVVDVEKSLPPKSERILRVAMSPLQKQYYKWILKKNVHELNKGASGSGQVSLLNIMVELQKCCNHPFLFESADVGYRGKDGIHEGATLLERTVLSSGKMILLDKLLVRLKETGHRVLIFSQMVRMLDILADYLRLRGFLFQRLDGRTPARQRQHAMDHFNAPGSSDFAFLLSTKAGGLGVNLATADTVVIFDSDWNPKNDLQAIARAHRIGQKDVVNIYRFVIKDSVEENILERAKQKLVLDHLVIQKMDTSGRTVVDSKKQNVFDKKELATILRFGAEGLFKDETKVETEPGTEQDATQSSEPGKEKAADVPEEDIDAILARAEQVTTGDGNSKAAQELLGAFKIADFDTSESDTAFWNRLIKPEEEEKKVEFLMPRASRLAVKSYKESQFQSEENDGFNANGTTKKRKGGPDPPVGKAHSKARAHLAVSNALVTATLDSPLIQALDEGNRYPPRREETTIAKNLVMSFGERFKDICAEVLAVNPSPDVKNEYERKVAFATQFIECCEEAHRKGEEDSLDMKGVTMDFYGDAIKVADVIVRLAWLKALKERVEGCVDRMLNFSVRDASSNIRSGVWTKSVGWTHRDDAMLLLGVYNFGFGKWETIRDSRQYGNDLNLGDKIGGPAPRTAKEKCSLDGLPHFKQIDTRARSLLAELAKCHQGAEVEVSPVKESENIVAAIMEPKKRTLKQFRDLSSNQSIDKSQVIKLTSQYIRELGDTIEMHLNTIKSKRTKAKNDKDLWDYVSDYVRTLDGKTLRSMYFRLKAKG